MVTENVGDTCQGHPKAHDTEKSKHDFGEGEYLQDRKFQKIYYITHTRVVLVLWQIHNVKEYIQ